MVLVEAGDLRHPSPDLRNIRRCRLRVGILVVRVGSTSFMHGGYAVMANKRKESQTIRCTWCQRVRTATSWRAERRTTRPGGYTNSICHQCRSYYLTGFDLEGFVKWCKNETG